MRRSAALAAAGVLLAACGAVDSRIEWRHGKYALMWIDDPARLALYEERGSGAWTTVVEPTVFAVGADARYVVVRQHPAGNRRVTNAFVVDAGPPASPGEHGRSVIGPLSDAELRDRAARFRLPPFTTVLEALR